VPTTAGDVIGSIVEHNSGWREDADTHDGVDLSEDDFNYDEFIKQEFGSQAKPAGLETVWWMQHPHESNDERAYIAKNSYENAGTISLGMTSEQAAKRRGELTKSQHPFAIILSCSDSRVPPEIVFDEGLGDLFGVRVAGNVLTDEGLGSIEYAVDILGAKLIVVLGHQSCGAVDAALKTVAAKGKAPGHIQSLVKAIKPVVDSTPKGDLDTMIKANVKHVVDALRSSTPILKAKVDAGEVQVIGGYYTLETGAVTFLEGK